MSLQRFTSFCHARTFFVLNTRLSVRLCSSKISKNLKSAKLYEPRDVVHNYYNFYAARERFFKPSVRCISTAYHLLRESSISTGEKTSATVKDEATIISQLNSEFYEEEADIPNRQPKPRATVVQYKLDQNGFMKVQDLVDFLKKESAVDICVIKTRGIRQNYVDYFVVVSGVSTRHIRAMAKNLELLFKGKMLPGIGKGGHPVVEGMESNHWVALDIGNIVVHFFLPEVREVYELEKLWTLGPQYDDQSRAFLEEERFRQATEYGIKLDKPVSDEPGEDGPVVEELGMDDPRRY